MLENATSHLRGQIRQSVLCTRTAAFGWRRCTTPPLAYVRSPMRALFIRPPPERPLSRVAHEDSCANCRRQDASLSRAAIRCRGWRRAWRVAPCWPCRCSRTMKLIGAIAIYRQEVRPFTDKQIALVQNFAAQAVIAIENTRLLNELRAIAGAADGHIRCAEVISSSPGNLEPVFQAMLENAVRICEANFGISAVDNETFPHVALRKPRKHVASCQHDRGPFRRSARSSDRMCGQKCVALSPTLADADPEAPIGKADWRAVHLLCTDAEGERTCWCDPHLSPGNRPFTDRQIELRTSPPRPSSPSRTRDCSMNCVNRCNNRPPLPTYSRSSAAPHSICKLCSDTLVESAARLCDAEKSEIYGGQAVKFTRLLPRMRYRPNHTEILEKLFIVPGRKTCVGRALLEHKTVQILDTRSDLEYANPAIDIGVTRTMLWCAFVARGNTDWRTCGHPFWMVQPFTDQAGCFARNLCRPSRDRHRERAAVRGRAAAHARAFRNHWSSRRRHRMCWSVISAGHRASLNRCSRCHAGESNAHMRSQVRHTVSTLGMARRIESRLAGCSTHPPSFLLNTVDARGPGLRSPATSHPPVSVWKLRKRRWLFTSPNIGRRSKRTLRAILGYLSTLSKTGGFRTVLHCANAQ